MIERYPDNLKSVGIYDCLFDDPEIAFRAVEEAIGEDSRDVYLTMAWMELKPYTEAQSIQSKTGQVFCLIISYFHREHKTSL